MSYKEIIDKYIENDIFIHMGTHEGLGLGFYESLYCGCPILTINCIPNNEIIINNINGWLIECKYVEPNDNNDSIINMSFIHEKILQDKIEEIIVNNDKTLKIINNTINNIKNIYNVNKDKFENNIKNILDIEND
jgi:glycosyltransferase involved in cell wall biosynthesis